MGRNELNTAITHLFRTESGKLIAVLTRLLGFDNLDSAEDIVQDTLLQAMKSWPFNGVPENPTAWMYAVAKRKAIDVLRKNAVRKKLAPDVARFLSSEYTLATTVNHYFLENEIEDNQLRMMFALCHPAIPYEAQIALTLKTLCGLSVSEIAKSFLTTEENITKRLFRAREKIRDENVSLAVPQGANLIPRMEAVHHTVYLLFNEGYHSSNPDHVIREELCAEAIRLALILTSNSQTNTPETKALLALMCLQAAREDARLDAQECIVLLRDQDRTKWNKPLIEKGLDFLNAATESPSVSAYHLEAAIAGYHVIAPSFEATDWKKIVSLYEALENFKPHPIIRLNKAIAAGYAFGPRKGIEGVVAITGLESSHLYYMALGEFYFLEHMKADALIAYQRALQLVHSSSEKKLIEKKLLLVTQ